MNSWDGWQNAAGMNILINTILFPNRKTDTNNHGPINMDNIGMSDDYIRSSYERRRSIVREHEGYQRGILYFLRTDKRIPDHIRDLNNSWGLAKDEFIDNRNWPRQLYIREGRRMKDTHVITEREILGEVSAEESVGMGSYTLDSHNAHRYVDSDGFVQDEGDIGVIPKGPYTIHRQALFPIIKAECVNLAVPVCLSVSHGTYGSIRMEPVFMILGQSAAAAAVLAADEKCPLQDVPYSTMEKVLKDEGQVLGLP
jgi:hypothetical protein